VINKVYTISVKTKTNTKIPITQENGLQKPEAKTGLQKPDSVVY
jgi:hypothetical protein